MAGRARPSRAGWLFLFLLQLGTAVNNATPIYESVPQSLPVRRDAEYFRRFGEYGLNYDVVKGKPVLRCLTSLDDNNTILNRDGTRSEICEAAKNFSDKVLGCFSIYRLKNEYNVSDIRLDDYMNASMTEVHRASCWTPYEFSMYTECGEDACIIDASRELNRDMMFCCCRQHNCNSAANVKFLSKKPMQEQIDANLEARERRKKQPWTVNLPTFEEPPIVSEEQDSTPVTFWGVFKGVQIFSAGFAAVVSGAIVFAVVFVLVVTRCGNRERVSIYVTKNCKGWFCSLQKGEKDGKNELVHFIASEEKRLEEERERNKNESKKPKWRELEYLLDNVKQFEEENIQIGRELSRGSFGAIYKAVLKKKDVKPQVVALKYFSFENLESFNNEKTIYSAITPFVDCDETSGCIGSVTMKNGYGLILDLCEMGNMEQYLKRSTFTEKDAILVAFSLAKGIHFLHCQNEMQGRLASFAHRDLKTRNILMTSHTTVRIADFGLALLIHDHKIQQNEETHVQVGTNRYMSPEMMAGAIMQNERGYKMSDMYTIGLIFWEIMNRAKLHDEDGERTVVPATAPYEYDVTKKLLENPEVTRTVALRQVVCKEGRRPQLRTPGAEDTGAIQFKRVIVDCWHQLPEARLVAGTVKSYIEGILVHMRTDDVYSETTDVGSVISDNIDSLVYDDVDSVNSDD